MFAACSTATSFAAAAIASAREVVEAGRADQDRDARGNRPVEARLERRRRGEIDQHVAMILVDREARVFGDGRRDRLAHPPLGAKRLMRIGCSSVRMGRTDGAAPMLAQPAPAAGFPPIASAFRDRARFPSADALNCAGRSRLRRNDRPAASAG